MSCSKEISEELAKCKIFEVFNEKEEESESKKLSEEEKYLMQLDDEETNIDKIAEASYNFLLNSSINDAIKVVNECHADGKTYIKAQEN